MDKDRPTVAVTPSPSNDTIHSVLFHGGLPSLSCTAKTAATSASSSSVSPSASLCRHPSHLSTTKNPAFITSLIGTVSGYNNPRDPRIVDMVLPCTMLVLARRLLIALPHPLARLLLLAAPAPSLPPATATEDIAIDRASSATFVPPSSLATPLDSITQAWRTRCEESQATRSSPSRMARAASELLAACWAASVNTGYGVCWFWTLISWAARVHCELEREKREWTARGGCTSTRASTTHPCS
ncbi:hypothetical protein FOMPIDRAFT_1048505 [Fomitopsis schrenkii]|uniref:Uncharacterized protein n=1 Tax=Fomitopsis schrenkii TaxID=2126942 RepID=S8EBB2_FOMSC|nr:hypothetical protein FOMPIDRAFT_1048505 [Fomitopsis schrenkii]